MIGVPCLNQRDRYGSYKALIINAAETSIGNVDHDLYITEDTHQQGLAGLVECCNKIVDKLLEGDYTHLWLVELDVQVPRDAFTKLLSLNADIAMGYYPSHNDFNRLVAGWMGPDGGIYYLPRFALKGQILRGWVFAGSGCLLIKRQVFEAGLRFKLLQSMGPDVAFCFDCYRKGFTGALHGDVECGHLPEFPLQEGGRHL